MADTHKSAFCPRYHRAAELVGRRWSGAIIRALLQGVSRFGELADAIPGISARMLAERLRELEAEDVVVRAVTTEGAVRIHYELTYKGKALARVVEALTEWAHDWTEAQPGDPADHAHPTAPRKAARR